MIGRPRYANEARSRQQQQRVALARAIKPKVLLLDEPSSALDWNLRGSMQVEPQQIQRDLGVTTIFVTDDQGEALSMSDRIAVMSAGRIHQVAAPSDVYRCAERWPASHAGRLRRGRSAGNNRLAQFCYTSA